MRTARNDSPVATLTPTDADAIKRVNTLMAAANDTMWRMCSPQWA